VDHVLGALLVGEMTQRTPVVYWGSNSLFRGDATANAFELYFEPVSQATPALLQDPALQYFPPKWSAHNALADDVNQWHGPYSRMAGQYLLNRPEEVVVSDFHIRVNDLVPWIRPGHPLHGLATLAVYRQLFQRYIRLQARVAEQVEAVWREKLAPHAPLLAVHVRGSDKFKEYPQMERLNEQYERFIAELLARRPELSIFLLTDSETVLEQYRQRYGSKVVCTDSTRTRSNVGLHYQGLSGHTLGMEVLADACLAARCDYFIGSGPSNVSTAVHHMKDWGPGAYGLIGPVPILQRNLFLHDW
jgi:hypothetical protein